MLCCASLCSSSRFVLLRVEAAPGAPRARRKAAATGAAAASQAPSGSPLTGACMHVAATGALAADPTARRSQASQAPKAAAADADGGGAADTAGEEGAPVSEPAPKRGRQPKAAAGAAGESSEPGAEPKPKAKRAKKDEWPPGACLLVTAKAAVEPAAERDQIPRTCAVPSARCTRPVVVSPLRFADILIGPPTTPHSSRNGSQEESPGRDAEAKGF